MRRSLSPGSFSHSNIPRCFSSLESSPKPQYPGHHGPCCCPGTGGFTSMGASKGCRLSDVQVVHENMHMLEYVRKLLRAFGLKYLL